MKTSKKILLISLDLFNSQGEQNITSVDIAMELDISPGNLYYHYKGKEQIIKALVGMYCDQIEKITLPECDENLTLEQLFIYIQQSMHTLYLFRFIFQNSADLSIKYPDINKVLKRSASTQRKKLEQILSSLLNNRILICDESNINFLLDIISLTMYQSFNFYQMQGTTLDDPDVIYQSLMTVFFSLQPFYKNEIEANNALKLKILNKSLSVV